MSDKKIIAAEIQVDTAQATTNVKTFNTEVNKTNESLNKVGTTAKGAGDEVKTSGGHFGKLKDQMAGLPGPLGSATEGVNKLGVAFKALLANPVAIVIGAIVAALALLYKAFQNTFEGGQKLEQVFAGIKAAAQALLDNLGKVASAIVKLFKFDFSGAVQEIKEVGQAAGKAFEQMSKLTKEAQALAREQAENDLDQAKRQAKLAELKEKAQDPTIGAAERKRFAQELLKESEENAKADLDLAKRTAENKIAQLTLEKEGEQKNFIEIQKIRADQVRGETENANELKQIRKQVNQADKEIEAEAKQRHADALARQKELAAETQRIEKERLDIERQKAEDARKQAAIDIENAGKKIKQQEEENEKARLDALANKGKEIDPNLIRAKNAQLANDLIKQSEKEKTEYVLELAQAEADARIQLLGGISNALMNLSNLAGKQTAVGKALAIASTTIDTYQSAIAAFKSLAPIPYVGPILGGIAAAAAVANGIAAVKNIVKVQIPGQGSGGGATPSPLAVQTPAAPVAPTVAGTRLDAGSINDVGNAANKPVRSYVLQSEGASEQEKFERLQRAARLNG